MRYSLSRKRRQQSLGEFISTTCFLVVGGYFFIDGFLHWQNQAWLTAISVWACAAFVFSAGFRFILAQWWLSYRRWRGR